MNWLEFIVLAVVGLVAFAGVMATVMLSIWVIKMCLLEISEQAQAIKKLFFR